MVFLKISQNPQENTCAGVSFNKGVFLWNFEKYWRTPFLQIPLDDCFWHFRKNHFELFSKEVVLKFLFFIFFFNCTNSTKSRNTSQYLITFVKNGHAWLLFYGCLLPFKVFTKQFYQLMIFLIWWERFQQTLVKADLEKFDSIYLTHIHQRFSGDFRG